MGLLAFPVSDKAFGFAVHKVLLVGSLAEQVACLPVLRRFGCRSLVPQKEKVGLGCLYTPSDRSLGLLGLWS